MPTKTLQIPTTPARWPLSPGSTPAPWSPARPTAPHLLFPELTAQVHLGLAEGDMKPGAISKLNQALDAAGVGYTTEIYPGTIHGFTMSDTDAFNPSALRRHWDRLLPLLDRTLGACPGQSR